MDVISVLQRLGAGRVLEELQEALNGVAEDVVETGKSATVTVAFKVTTKSQGDPLVVIDGSVTRSHPKKDPIGAYFFAVDGQLHKDDPRQPELPQMRAVEARRGEVREAVTPEKVERSIL